MPENKGPQFDAKACYQNGDSPRPSTDISNLSDGVSIVAAWYSPITVSLCDHSNTRQQS